MTVGTQVRVPLSGRRVRGWVVELGERPAEKLKDLSGVSGEVPVFDPPLFRSLSWASVHYVAPLSVVLAKASPPNLPGRLRGSPMSDVPSARSDHPLAPLAGAAAAGVKRPALALVGPWRDLGWIRALGPVLAAGKSAAVVTATGAEVDEVASRAESAFPGRVVAVPTEGDKEITESWLAAQRPGALVVGPPRLACWQVAELALVVVLEEGRRAMKDRQTPTIHVREMARTRSRAEGFNLAFLGPTPSVEILAAGATVQRSAPRAWGTVEIVDRSGEPPGSGLLSDRTVAALRALSRTDGARAFLFTGRKQVAPVVDEVNRKIGRGAAGAHPDGVIASVGSERDLAGLEPVRLAVAVNVDYLPGSAGYRADEEAIRQLARLGNTLASGGRLIAQTAQPTGPLAVTLRRGDPIPYLEQVLVDRARQHMPPAREMLAVEVRGEVAERVSGDMASLDGVEVFGPATIDSGLRWLITGRLDRVRPRLRELASSWRERGTTVRIDADPIDL